MTASTGPKISSCAMVIELSTSANTVGCTNQPLSRPSGRPPPVTIARALLDALLDVALDALALLLGDQRADHRRGIVGQADRHRGDGAGNLLDDLVVARPRRKDAGLADAGLAAVHQTRRTPASAAWSPGRRLRG